MVNLGPFSALRSKVLKVIGSIIAVTLMSIVLVSLTQPQKASALSPGEFDPGFIISDEIFYNSSSMTAGEIQEFLNSKVPNCESYSGAAKVINWNNSYPDNPIYPCLRDYSQTTPQINPDAYCRGFPGTPYALSAASIIAAIADSCGVNPQVLLVLLEKEQVLISDTWPAKRQFDRATGFRCFDNPFWCDPAYSGFFMQMYYGARQYQMYTKNPGNYNYRVGYNSRVLWHPNASECGSEPLTIRNQATANLYIYTPYRPNQAALNYALGLGPRDACSSFGNVNFWKMFSNWFGPTTITPETTSFLKALYQDFLGRIPSSNEIGNWGQDLSSGAPVSAVANGFVDSDEYRTIRIRAAYQSVLGRNAEQAGLTNWLDGMRNNILETDDVEKSFLASEEYFNNNGGTNISFVSSLYTRLIGRAATPPEAEAWASQIPSRGRYAIVSDIWNAVETSRSRVAVMYQSYLGRTPDVSGLQYWGTFALTNGDSATRSALTSSSEYRSRAVSRYP